MVLSYSKINEGYYIVYYKNEVLVGKLIKMEDGFFRFWADKSDEGCWSSVVLFEIATKLDELNEEREKEILNLV